MLRLVASILAVFLIAWPSRALLGAFLQSPARATVHGGTVELVGTMLSSTDDGMNHAANVNDGDFTTYFNASSANGAWVGVDAGQSVTVRAVVLASRIGTGVEALDYDNRVQRGTIQAADDSRFSVGLTTAYTVGARIPPTYRPRVFNTITLSTPPTKRYWRWAGAKGSNATLAELRFIADYGPANAKPVRPVVSPWGGRYPTGGATVTITTSTVGASIYYTIDGSTPTASSTLYKGAFTALSGVNASLTLKAVAYDPTLKMPYSDVVTASFKGYGYGPNEDYTDDHGDLLQAFGGAYLRGAGGVPLLVNGYYWLYGCSANRYSNGATIDGNCDDGIWLYKTTDFRNWILVGNILAPPGAFVESQSGRVLYNAANNNYVLWTRVYNGPRNADPALACVATAAQPQGPWSWVNTNCFDPDGRGFKDFGLLLDVNGTDAYIFYVDATQTDIYCSKLARNFQRTDGRGGLKIVANVPYESVIPVSDHEGKYLLWTTNPNFYDSTSTFEPANVYFSSSPCSRPYSVGRERYAKDPTGTNYNGQVSDVLKFDNGFLQYGNFWVRPQDTRTMYASRYVFTPIDDLSQNIARWDLSRFNKQSSNTLKTGLVAFFPLSELNTSDNAVERVDGLNATVHGTGNPNVQGIRLRSRLMSQNTHDYFEAASNATFQTGTIDFWFNVWVYYTGGGSFPTIFSKDDQSANREYGLFLDSTDGYKLKFYVSSDGTTIDTVTAAMLGTFPQNTWTMITCYHSTSLGKIGIFINRTLDTEIRYTSGVRAGSAAFDIAETMHHTNIGWNGRIRNLGMWKAAKPSETQLWQLYNSGLDLPYEYFN